MRTVPQFLSRGPSQPQNPQADPQAHPSSQLPVNKYSKITDNSIKIISHETLPGMPIAAHSAMDYALMKQKMFAFAVPSVW